MDSSVSRVKSIYMYITAWAIIPVMFLAWCFSTIAYKGSLYLYLCAFCGMLASGLYNVTFLYVVKNNLIYIKELLTLNVAIITGGILYLFVIHSEYPYQNGFIMYFVTLTWIIPAILGLLKNHQQTEINMIIPRLRAEKLFIALLLLTGVMTIDENMYQFKWDGLLYYSAVKEALLSSISSVALYGHNALASGALFRFFSAIINDTGYGMISANIIVFLLSVCAFYSAVKIIFNDHESYECVFATAVYALSPFLLGMSNYFSTDWFCVCISVIFIYFVLRREWIWTTILGCVFCYTKEPALIAYTGTCIGLIVADMVKYGSFGHGMREIVKKLHYYFMLIPYLIWIVSYKILGKWSAGGGEFALDTKYMLKKLKVFCILNFNWILIFIAIIGLFNLLKKRRLKEQAWWVFPLLFSNICLIVFNLLFKTVNHARYIDSFIAYSIMLAVGFISISERLRKYRKTIYVFMAVISLTSCFICIDPVSLLTFNKEKVGKSWLITTDEDMFGDASIYNKQMLWLENPLSRAISDSVEEGTAIVLITENGSIYSVDGMSEKISMSGNLDKDIQYWDENKRRRIPYASEHIDIASPIIVFHADENKTLECLDCENETISVIYINDGGEYAVTDKYRYIGTEEYSYRGWMITRDVYRLDMVNSEL